MRTNFFIEKQNPKEQKNIGYFGVSVIVVFIAFIIAFVSACSHENISVNDLPGNAQPISNAIAATIPADNADTVAINPIVAVTLKSAQDTSILKTSTLSLKEGTSSVTGTVSYSGTTIIFTPSADLKPETKYTASISASVNNTSGEKDEHSWTFTTGKGRDNNAKLSIVSVTPLKGATDVLTDVHPVIIFNKKLTSSVTNSFSVNFKQGSTVVSGSITYSGMTATFIPSSELIANTVYTGTVIIGNKTGNTGDDEGENENGDDDHQSSDKSTTFTWSFTTGGTGVDTTAPVVSSVNPTGNATNVSLSVHPTVTFSEAMKSSTINSTTFTLKNGATPVAGTVNYSGTTATFTPSASLDANTVYTGTINTGVTDVAGNALAADYTWSFTTSAGADVTPPTVTTVVPANNAVDVALSSRLTVNFSEAMDQTTLTSSTFTVKQGTTSITGTVTYSGNTATFTPSSALTGSKVYTATITTGAKDAAGNALASNYTWSFTSVAPVSVVSFASQVLPILQNKCMPCHSGSNPPAGVTITNYTAISTLSNSQIDNPNMYPKMGVTAAEQALIKAWIAAGRLNN